MEPTNGTLAAPVHMWTVRRGSPGTTPVIGLGPSHAGMHIAWEDPRWPGRQDVVLSSLDLFLIRFSTYQPASDQVHPWVCD
jgi:hypothetical protein